MGQVTVERTIHAPATAVWRVLADFGGVHRFHPAVETSPLLNGQSSGLGAQRQCNFYDGRHAVEQVVGWDEGRAIDIDIIGGDMPLKSGRGRLSVETVSQGVSVVTMTMTYKPKGGPLGAVMDVLMMRGMFRKMLGKVLDGLDQHVTTGAEVGKRGELSGAVAA